MRSLFVWVFVFGVFAVGALPAAVAAWWFHHALPAPGSGQVDPVFEFFTKNMRGSFFAGFLTIGGFMLSLKTFVLVKMKEGLYDSAAYKEHAERARAFGHTESHYAPLRRLSHLLFFSILAALVTSALQLTVGLIPRWWAAAACLSFAGGTIVLLLVSLLQIKQNLDVWFTSLDEDAGKQSATRPQ
ncbi:hypothetical protein [Anaeromyxobacter dehalogenans]|uniref:Transmembrane protein n=2 Tax=Anaeromyxobacter dehalogenans TaxID=161493 RepID=Q2IFN3_ANADE|nr:hypothetical protein [Anaeromyxobacter dehalogenans]ABC83391.1 hypothetical protein Adeh_3625 [Anaeromyxobacter dehalogenans 2CP-C]ACL67088.1 hypothetical protein A2cp1_3763 [Anaeromyxobacter dehalogenans 2CP-1]